MKDLDKKSSYDPDFDRVWALVGLDASHDGGGAHTRHLLGKQP